MYKEHLHRYDDNVSLYEYIERDLQLYGEEYCLGLDSSEFLLNYGITKEEFLNEYSIEYSLYTKEKFTTKKKLHPFTEESMEKLVDNFKKETIKLLSNPKVTSSTNHLKKASSPSPIRTSVRPSKMKRKGNNPNIEAEERRQEIKNRQVPSNSKPKPRPMPYPAPMESSKKGPYEAIKKEYRLYVKALLRSSRSSLAKRRINLHNKAFKSAVTETGAVWGSEEWFELLLKFFPGTDPTTFTTIQTDSADMDIAESDDAAKTDNVTVEDKENDTETNEDSDSTETVTQNKEEDKQEAVEDNEISDEAVNEESPDATNKAKTEGNTTQENQTDKKSSAEENAGQKKEGVKPSSEEPATFEKPEINFTDEDTAGMATSFANNTAIEHVERHRVANEQMNSFVAKDYELLTDKLPEIEQPTGIERTDTHPENTEAQISEKESENDFPPQGDEVKAEIDTTHEQPALNINQISNETFTDSEEEQVDKDDVESAVKKLPISDPELNSEIGDIPEVPLTGVTDPAQLDENSLTAEKEVNSQHIEANLESLKDFGENDIYPTIEKEILTPNLEITEVDIPVFEVEPLPENLPQDIADALNTELEQERQEQIEPQIDKVTEKKLETEKQQQQEIDNTLAEIDAETEKTEQLQRDEQTNTQNMVRNYQAEWQSENEQILTQFNTDAENERLNAQGEIDNKISETQQITNETITNADQQIESEKEVAEQEAQEAKDSATKKQSWWQKALKAVGNFFDSVKKAVTNVFNALRKKVKQIIEDAKKFVSNIIDAASNFIKNTIKLFGEALKGLVTIALFAFPKVAKRINGLIDKGVEAACKVVDTLAEGLKKAVCLLLDGLGILLDSLLVAFHALLMFALEYYKIFTKMIVMYLQRLVQTVVGLLLVAASIVILLAIIGGGGIFAALWKSIEGKPELQRSVLTYIFDTFEKLLDTIPPDLLGPLSTMFIHMLRGFLSKSRAELLDGDNFEKGITVVTKLARIASGEDGDFLWSFIKNIFVGIWDSIKDIFISIWELIKFIVGIPKMIINVVEAIISIAPDIADMLSALFGNFMTMVEEFRKDGPGFLENLAKNLSPERIMAFFESMKEKIASFSFTLGERVGTKFVTFMLSDDATTKIGAELGKFTGMVIFEVLLAVFTAGIGSAAKWGLKVAKPLIRIATKIGKGGRFLGKLSRIFIRGLKTVIRALSKIASKIQNITQKALKAFKGFLDEIMEGLTKILRKLGFKVDYDHVKFWDKLSKIKDKIENIQDKVEFVQELKGTIDQAITNKLVSDIKPSLEQYGNKYDLNKLYEALNSKIKVKIGVAEVSAMLAAYSEKLNNNDNSGLDDEIIGALMDGCIEQVRTGAVEAMNEAGIAAEDQSEMLQLIIDAATDSFYDGMAQEVTFYVAKFLAEKLSEEAASNIGQSIGDRVTGSGSDSNTSDKDDDNTSNDSEENNNDSNVEETQKDDGINESEPVNEIDDKDNDDNEVVDPVTTPVVLPEIQDPDKKKDDDNENENENDNEIDDPDKTEDEKNQDDKELENEIIPDELNDKFENGWTKEQILDKEKGDRPKPEEYLSKEYIAEHIAKFEEEGACFLVVKPWIENGRFESFPMNKYAMLKSDMDAALKQYQETGDIRVLEDALGYEPGDLEGLENEIYIFEVDKEQFTFEMPSGNEIGANDLWEPGGKTSGGKHEAVLIDRNNPDKPIIHNKDINELTSQFAYQTLDNLDNNKDDGSNSNSNDSNNSNDIIDPDKEQTPEDVIDEKKENEDDVDSDNFDIDKANEDIEANLVNKGVTKSDAEDIILRAMYIDEAIGNNQMLKTIQRLSNDPNFNDASGLRSKLESVFSKDQIDEGAARSLLNELNETDNQSNNLENINSEKGADIKNFNYEYREVEIVDNTGKPLGEFDGIDVTNKTFIEDKSAKGLDIVNPRTNQPAQTPKQWAEKQIFNKSSVRIENLNEGAVATRPTKDGSQSIPSIDEIKDFKSLHFKIDNDTPELRSAVNEQLIKLKDKYPDWEFTAEFGNN